MNRFAQALAGIARGAAVVGRAAVGFGGAAVYVAGFLPQLWFGDFPVLGGVALLGGLGVEWWFRPLRDLLLHTSVASAAPLFEALVHGSVDTVLDQVRAAILGNSSRLCPSIVAFDRCLSHQVGDFLRKDVQDEARTFQGQGRAFGAYLTAAGWRDSIAKSFLKCVKCLKGCCKLDVVANLVAALSPKLTTVLGIGALLAAGASMPLTALALGLVTVASAIYERILETKVVALSLNVRYGQNSCCLHFISACQERGGCHRRPRR
jgi:hypothetical protein